jgi:hypothetical protein
MRQLDLHLVEQTSNIQRCSGTPLPSKPWPTGGCACGLGTPSRIVIRLSVPVDTAERLPRGIHTPSTTTSQTMTTQTPLLAPTWRQAASAAAEFGGCIRKSAARGNAIASHQRSRPIDAPAVAQHDCSRDNLGSAIPSRSAVLWSESAHRGSVSDVAGRGGAHRKSERRVGVEVALGEDAECRQGSRPPRGAPDASGRSCAVFGDCSAGLEACSPPDRGAPGLSYSVLDLR